MAVEPIVDHRMSQRFRLFAVASYDFPGAFNITGMNGYAPLVPFDPGAEARQPFHVDKVWICRTAESAWQFLNRFSFGLIGIGVQ
jgi:hypothetical protein